MAYGLELSGEGVTSVLSQDFDSFQVYGVYTITSTISNNYFIKVSIPMPAGLTYAPLIFFGYGGSATRAAILASWNSVSNTVDVITSAAIKVAIILKSVDCGTYSDFGLAVYNSSGTRVFNSGITSLSVDTAITQAVEGIEAVTEYPFVTNTYSTKHNGNRMLSITYPQCAASRQISTMSSNLCGINGFVDANIIGVEPWARSGPKSEFGYSGPLFTVYSGVLYE